MSLIKKLREDKRKEDEQKRMFVPVVKRFDEGKFDKKVARIVSDIHSEANYRKKNTSYNLWVRQYHAELRDMYIISEAACSFNDFCSYVYQSSDY